MTLRTAKQLWFTAFATATAWACLLMWIFLAALEDNDTSPKGVAHVLLLSFGPLLLLLAALLTSARIYKVRSPSPR